MQTRATDEASLKEGTVHFELVPNTLPGFGLRGQTAARGLVLAGLRFRNGTAVCPKVMLRCVAAIL